MLDDDEEKKIENSEEKEEKTQENEQAQTAEPKEMSFETVSSHETDKSVTVQPVQFASFEDMDQIQGTENQNLNILLDVKLQLSVELGRTDLPIKKVLELTKGSIVTLSKAAGEPVELYANGKLIADNFGLRITHITDPVKRLSSINGGNEQQQIEPQDL